MSYIFTPQGGEQPYDQEKYSLNWSGSSLFAVGQAIGVQFFKDDECFGSMHTEQLLISCEEFLKNNRLNPFSEESRFIISRVKSLTKLCKEAIKQGQPIIAW